MYKRQAHEYPFLAFTFKGRIKSLIRAEEKFNGYIVEYIYDYYTKHGTYPPVSELKNKLSCFRDFIAYRIVVCLPRCHLKPGEDQEQASIRYLYKIANVLPGFLEEMLKKQYGEEAFAKILAGYQARRPVTLRVNPLKADRNTVEQALTGAGIAFKNVSWYELSLIHI